MESLAANHHSIALSHRQHQHARAKRLHHNQGSYEVSSRCLRSTFVPKVVIYGEWALPKMWSIDPSGKAKRTADVLVPAVSTFQGLSTSLLHQAKIKVLLPFCCSIPRLQRKGI